MTIDPELGHVYLPVEMPTGDLYGGHRPGDNLFSDSIVALDLETGERVWHFQTIHHDVWDFDLPNAPILVDITVDGREIKALAQPSKQAFLMTVRARPRHRRAGMAHRGAARAPSRTCRAK